MNDAAEAAVLGALQLAALVAAAPLLNGLIRSVKRACNCGVVLRSAGYRDLAKWLARGEQVADSTSFVHWSAPVVVIAAVLSAALIVPVFSDRTPLSPPAISSCSCRCSRSRARSSRSRDGQRQRLREMGSSRELAISALVEPVSCSRCGSGDRGGSTRLGDIVAFGEHEPSRFLGLAWALRCGVQCRAGRRDRSHPFDNRTRTWS